MTNLCPSCRADQAEVDFDGAIYDTVVATAGPRAAAAVQEFRTTFRRELEAMRFWLVDEAIDRADLRGGEDRCEDHVADEGDE